MTAGRTVATSIGAYLTPTLVTLPGRGPITVAWWPS
jgi:hypothetical protein